MSNLDLIWFVIVGYYVIDLWTVVTPQAVIFHGGGSKSIRGRLSILHGIRLRTTLYLCFTTWKPWGRAWVTEFLPIEIDPDEVRLAPHFPLQPFVPHKVATMVRLSDKTRVVSDGPVLDLDGSRVRLSSKAMARQLAQLVASMKNNPDNAPKLHQQALTRRFDRKAIRVAVDAYEDVAGTLRQISLVALLHIFFVLPLWRFFSAEVSVWRLIFAWCVLLAVIQALYIRAYRRLFPEGRGAAWGHAVAMIVSPAEAILAPVRLGRDCLALFHPLAVAAEVATPESFRDLAARTWRSVWAPTLGGAEPCADEEQIRRLLGQMGVDISELQRPPEPELQCRSYCPRCLQQLTAEPRGECPGCPTIGMLPLVVKP